MNHNPLSTHEAVAARLSPTRGCGPGSYAGGCVALFAVSSELGAKPEGITHLPPPRVPRVAGGNWVAQPTRPYPAHLTGAQPAAFAGA